MAEPELEPEMPEMVAVLRRLATVRAEVERLEYDVMALVRANGATWEQIGDELGISRQAARQRFAVLRKRQSGR